MKNKLTNPPKVQARQISGWGYLLPKLSSSPRTHMEEWVSISQKSVSQYPFPAADPRLQVQEIIHIRWRAWLLLKSHAGRDLWFLEWWEPGRGWGAKNSSMSRHGKDYFGKKVKTGMEKAGRSCWDQCLNLDKVDKASRAQDQLLLGALPNICKLQHVKFAFLSSF